MPVRLGMEKTSSILVKYSLDAEYCHHLASCLVYALYFGVLIVKIIHTNENSRPYPIPS
jgi:hypothetical protein